MNRLKKNVVITVDVEDWYHTNGYNFPIDKWDEFEDRLEQNTLYLLDLFDAHNTKGTFFILGEAARKHPELVLEIDRRGHEIGCHSNWHQLFYNHERAYILKDIIEAKEILEGIIKKEVIYFRAPSWSIGKDELWVLNELSHLGFKCDSSIQPFWTPLSGFSSSPTQPFKPVIGGEKQNIIEFPSTVLTFGCLRIPFSGGLYMRILPYVIFKNCLKRQSSKGLVMVYCHPWEYDLNLPKVKTTWFKHFIHHYNIPKNRLKLEKALSEFKCIPLGTAIENTDFTERMIK